MKLAGGPRSDMASEVYRNQSQSESSIFQRLWSLIWGMNHAPPKRLCKTCLAIFTSIRSAPAGSWIGSKPRSFGYPESSYLWGGSHHTLPGSFLSSVKIGCYICSIIFRDCNDFQRELAKGFQIFYRLYELRDGSTHDGMIRFGLQFGIEVEQNNQDALGEFFYDCQGDFKVLPFKGPLKRFSS